MKFKTSKETQDFLEKVYYKVHADNKAIFGRTGLFLALGEGLPKGFTAKSDGVDLSDETILGNELAIVVKAALNHRAGKELTPEEYSKAFRLYFEYGNQRLAKIWEDAGHDLVEFVSKLTKLNTDFLQETSFIQSYGNSNNKTVDTAVKLKIFENHDGWTINESGGNGLMVVSGKPGRGKTQLVLDLLVQLAKQNVKFLFFDMKGELENSDSQSEERNFFFKETKVKYTQLIDEKLPINPLIRGKKDAENAQIATEVAALVKAFASQLGAIQENDIRDAYQELTSPDFSSLIEKIQEKSSKGVSQSILKKIDDFKLFSDSETSIPITKWLEHSQVIGFKKLGNDNETKSLAVAFILNTIMRQLNRNLPIINGIQPLQMVLFIDEAHLLLPKEGKSGLLGSLARQGRSWGFPVWLASQDADAFLTTGNNATDFSELADCAIHFSPETLNVTQQKKILGQIFHNKSFSKGEALLRLKHKQSQVGNVRQFYKNKGKV